MTSQNTDVKRHQNDVWPQQNDVYQNDDVWSHQVARTLALKHAAGASLLAKYWSEALRLLIRGQTYLLAVQTKLPTL